jgi:thiosulfate dehydrogenase [quinone] large subunit
MKFICVLLRILLGWQFLWAFIDKTFGFGFSTAPENAWIYGGSPTAGFLQLGSRGPFAPFFNSIGGTVLVDWLFMMAMLALGLSLIFGLLVRFSSIVSIFVLALMYLAAIPPATNPFVDYHIIYIIVLIGIFIMNAGKYFGLDYLIFRKRPVAAAAKKTVEAKKTTVQTAPIEERKTEPAKTADMQRTTDEEVKSTTTEEETITIQESSAEEENAAMKEMPPEEDSEERM